MQFQVFIAITMATGFSSPIIETWGVQAVKVDDDNGYWVFLNFTTRNFEKFSVLHIFVSKKIKKEDKILSMSLHFDADTLASLWWLHPTAFYTSSARIIWIF